MNLQHPFWLVYFKTTKIPCSPSHFCSVWIGSFVLCCAPQHTLFAPQNKFDNCEFVFWRPNGFSCWVWCAIHLGPFSILAAPKECSNTNSKHTATTASTIIKSIRFRIRYKQFQLARFRWYSCTRLNLRANNEIWNSREKKEKEGEWMLRSNDSLPFHQSRWLRSNHPFIYPSCVHLHIDQPIDIQIGKYH